MSETYNGWANRETWALMLYVNNDEGMQSEVRDLLRDCALSHPDRGAEALEDWAEWIFTRAGWEDQFGSDWPSGLADAASDIGSLWRVDWVEAASSIMEDIRESESLSA